jgi:hypothetical protein
MPMKPSRAMRAGRRVRVSQRMIGASVHDAMTRRALRHIGWRRGGAGD